MSYEVKSCGACWHRHVVALVMINALIGLYTAVLAPASPGFTHATWIWSLHALHAFVFVVAVTQALVIFHGKRCRCGLVLASINVLFFVAALARTAWLIEHSVRAH